MKVKIFWGHDIGYVESKLNDFIADKEIVDIKFSTHYNRDNHDNVLHALVLYK